MQFMVLGKYSNQGLAGFIQNPNDDRRAAISSMMEKAGGKLIDLHLTRGEYDIVAIGEVDSFDDIAAIKLLVASSGAVENLTILEMINMNSIANKAAAIAGAYRAQAHSFARTLSHIRLFKFLSRFEAANLATAAEIKTTNKWGGFSPPIRHY